MRALICQYLIALVFLGLGGWALFFPGHVIELGFTEAYRDDSFAMRFIMACFGAQAVMFGIMTLVVQWKACAFAIFAVVLIPFFGFNYYFHYEVPVLTAYGMIDFAGNLTMFIACLLGWQAARRDEEGVGGIVRL
ncbi:MAG: hypothetical protein AAGI28_01720 [Pseudomonadota bacterium]